MDPKDIRLGCLTNRILKLEFCVVGFTEDGKPHGESREKTLESRERANKSAHMEAFY